MDQTTKVLDINTSAKLASMIADFLVQQWPKVGDYIVASMNLVAEFNEPLYSWEKTSEPKTGISIRLVPKYKAEKTDKRNQYQIISACAMAALKKLNIEDVGYAGGVHFTNREVNVSFYYGASRWPTDGADRLIIYNKDWKNLIEELVSSG